MIRVVAALALVTACGALSYEPMDVLSNEPASPEALAPELHDDTADSQETDSVPISELLDSAEETAKTARRQLERIEAQESEEGIFGVSERQLDAEMKHAEAQQATLEGEERMLEKVIDAYDPSGEMERDAKVEAKFEAELGKLESNIKRTNLESQAFHGETGEWRDRDDAVSDIHRDVKREQREDQAFDKEEHMDTKLWKLASKKVENQLVKEKMYLHRRAALEHETHQRLAQEADAMRSAAAATGTLSEGEILRMLDISNEDLQSMMSTLAEIGRQGPENMTALWLDDKLAASRSKVEYASAKMLEAVKHKVETFKENPSDFGDQHFLKRVAHLIEDTRAEIKSVEEVKERERARLENWDKADGEKLTYSLGLALQGVTGNVEFKSHLQRIDTDRLAHANASTTDACDVLGNLVHTGMVPAYNSIHRQKETLDNMSKITPAVTAGMSSDLQDTMSNRTSAMLNMAYAHNLALKEVATVIVQEASPVVLNRLHCAMSGTPLRRGFGFGLVVAAAALAWLAQ